MLKRKDTTDERASLSLRLESIAGPWTIVLISAADKIELWLSRARHDRFRPPLIDPGQRMRGIIVTLIESVE